MEFSLHGGRIEQARWCPSENFDARPPGAQVELVVLHNISLPPGQFGAGYVEQFFCNRLQADAHPYFSAISGLRVSAHFLLARDGALTQFVNCRDRAWHAGVSRYCGRTACNDFSVGIELEGADTLPYSDAQYLMLVALLRALMRAYPRLHTGRISGHSDIAPLRKTDPGPAFDWWRLRLQLGQARRPALL